MRRWFPALALMLIPVGVAAQTIDTSRFRSRVGAGTMTGTEELSITRTSAGYDVTARIVLKRGGGETTFELREALASDWSALRYRIDMSGALGQVSVTAERKGDVMAFAMTTTAGSPAKDIPVKPRMVLLDNLLAAPLQVLLNATGATQGPVALVVPFQLVALDGTLESAGPASGMLDGRPVSLTKLVLKVAGVTMEIVAEDASLRLMRMFVPAQDAEIVREGFVLDGTPLPKAPESPPGGVVERAVSFTTSDGTVFPAVLSRPKSPGPVPLVVLMQGSGPHDRDETIGPNKPFRDLAWGLAARGIATLRYDKRTYAFPATYKGTLESESIDDGVSAVTFARALPDVAADRVFVLGHSLGGLAAIYVAQRVPVAGLLLAATGGRTLDLVIRDQVRALSGATDESAMTEILKQQDAVMAKVRAGTATAEDLRGQGSPASLRDVIIRDPIAELRKTSAPLFVLKGNRDAQVFQADFDALQAVARSRPGSDARLFSDLTHILTPTYGPAEAGAILQPARVAPEVIDAIADWVGRVGRR